MDVILDTNIIVSLFLTNNPTTTLIKQALLDESFQLVTSEPLLAEYQEVLFRPELERLMPNPLEVPIFLRKVLRAGRLVMAVEPYPKAPDPGDAFLLAMLRDNEIDYLVIGDKALLALEKYAGTPILSMRKFADSLTTQER